MPSEQPQDLNKLVAEMRADRDEWRAAHKEMQYHLVRLMERHDELMAEHKELKKQHIDLEGLTKQVAENNIRISRILEVHDYNIDELDARLRRLEKRRRGDLA